MWWYDLLALAIFVLVMIFTIKIIINDDKKE